MFKKIGILGHPLRPATAEICNTIAASLQRRGIEAWQRASWDAQSVKSLVAESDLVVAIGGDGSMLRAARVCAQAGVPVFGINAGYLGFLTEASPAQWETAADALLSGHYWTEERMMIRAELWRGEECILRDIALNDVVTSRGAVARSVKLETYIDGEWATTYNADGLIIATPTGSTAYALAVGGPILPPELKNILVVPVAAHLSFDRPLVLSEGATIEVIVAPYAQVDVMLSIDGESGIALQYGDRVVVAASDYRTRFIRLRDKNYFYRSILDRMEPRMPTRPDSGDDHLIHKRHLTNHDNHEGHQEQPILRKV